MAEEPKPIKTERIDNSDGSYTINEWYKTKKNEVAISYTSNTYYSNEIHSIVIYNKPLVGWKCIKRILTLDLKVLEADYFSDEESHDLLQHEEYTYNEDSYIAKIKDYTDNTSYITTYNYLEKVILREHYNDMEWQDLNFTEKPVYCDDGTFEIYVTYPTLEGEGYLSCIGFYDNEDDFINIGYPKIKKCYVDNNFKTLLMTYYYTVNKDLSYIEKVVYAEEPHNNHLSFIQHFDRLENIKKAYYYFDNNFTNLDYFAKTKYLKESYINYVECQNNDNGYDTIIVKYDYENKLIYKKQYKFKGILAHILFWLAR